MRKPLAAAALASSLALGAFASVRAQRAERRAAGAERVAAGNRGLLGHLATRVEAIDLGAVRTELQLCRQRTESLRRVLEVLIPSGIWPERVRLPDPPPGWAPWPALGGRDRPTTDDRP